MSLTLPESSGPHRLEFTGDPMKLAIPAVCAHCGHPGSHRLLIQRAHSRPSQTRKGQRTHQVVSISPAFCDACLALHHRQAQLLPPLTQLLNAFRSFLILPVIAASFFVILFGRWTLESLVKGDLGPIAFFGIGTLFFAGVAAVAFVSMLSETRHRNIVPPTTITQSVDISDDISATFEPRRHRYTLRNAAFAQALLATNQGKLYSEQQRAHAALKRRVMFAIIVIAIGLGVLYSVLLDMGLVPGG
jgi:hypothetical protein